MIDKGNYSPGQSAFAFSKDMTLTTFASATRKTNKKLVCLLSSMHDNPVICENGRPTPEIIMCYNNYDYNSMKSDVDTFDQLCSYQSYSRMTKIWLLTVFHGILNAAVVNSYTLYKEYKSQNSLKKWFFQKKLALSLIEPLAQRRFANTMLPPAVRSTSWVEFIWRKLRISKTRKKS